MPGGIFLIKDDGLVKMEESAYDSEELLQKLLEDYPDLLAGDQIDQDEPRRWLLISREMEISSEDSENRWSVDHLFLDQDGIPTLVEVKRSSDTRIRREVVGQMLDYAANAVIYWPIEKIQSKFEAHCQTSETDPDQEIQNLIGEDHDQDEFWQKVKTNLQAGKVRLVFVADVIPSELKRIVEFLNEQMDPAEVIAIEIKQFVGEGFKSMVPRVVGQTQQAMKKKGGAKKPKLNKQTFLEVCDEYGKSFFTDLINFAEKNDLTFRWGTAGFSMNTRINQKLVAVFYGFSPLAWFGQSSSTAFTEIRKNIKDPEPIIEELKSKINELGIFRETPKNITLDIKNHINKKKKAQLFETILFTVNKMNEHGLK